MAQPMFDYQHRRQAQKGWGYREDIGLITDEVADVIPELAERDAEGVGQGVNFRHLGAVLVAAVQESQAENKLLREQLEVAQARLDALEARMDKLLFAE